VKRLELERLVAAFEADPTAADKEAALWSALPSGYGSYPAELRPVMRLAREALGRAEEQQRAARREQVRVLQARAQRRTYQVLACVRAADWSARTLEAVTALRQRLPHLNWGALDASGVGLAPEEAAVTRLGMLSEAAAGAAETADGAVIRMGIDALSSCLLSVASLQSMEVRTQRNAAHAALSHLRGLVTAEAKAVKAAVLTQRRRDRQAEKAAAAAARAARRAEQAAKRAREGGSVLIELTPGAAGARPVSLTLTVKLPKPKAKGRPKPSASAERDPDYRTLADGRAEPPLLCRKPTGERLKLSDRLLRLMRAWYARGIFDGNGKPLDAAAEAFERAARLEPPSLLASHFSAVVLSGTHDPEDSKGPGGSNRFARTKRRNALVPLTVGDAFKTASGARGLVRSDQSARPMAHWRLVNPEFAVVLRDLLAHDGVPPSAIDTCLVSPMAYGGLALADRVRKDSKGEHRDAKSGKGTWTVSWGSGSNLVVKRLPEERLAAMGVAHSALRPEATKELDKTERGGESAYLSGSCNATHVHYVKPRGADAGLTVAFTVAVFFTQPLGAALGPHFSAE